MLPEGFTLTGGMDSQCPGMVGGVPQPCWVSEVAKEMVTHRGMVTELAVLAGILVGPEGAAGEPRLVILHTLQRKGRHSRVYAFNSKVKRRSRLC